MRIVKFAALVAKTRAGMCGLVCVAGLLLQQLPSAADPTFLSTSALDPDPGWSVAWEHGGYGDGISAFNDVLQNQPFGPAYYWGTEGGFPMIANNTTGTNGDIFDYVYFVFQQSFDLTGYDPATADLQFQWGCDDIAYTYAVGWTPQFSLNGGALQGAGTCGGYSLGGTVDLNSGFVNGLNTIDFFVEGNGRTDGLELSTVSFTAQEGSTPVPEPASWALFAAALTLLAGLGFRRGKRISAL
jgi:hypothetical protein